MLMHLVLVPTLKKSTNEIIKNTSSLAVKTSLNLGPAIYELYPWLPLLYVASFTPSFTTPPKNVYPLERVLPTACGQQGASYLTYL